MTEWFNEHELLIQTTLIYIPLAISFQLPIRCGVFSLIGVGFFAIGGYGTGILAIEGLHPMLSLALMLVFAGGAGFLMSIPLVRLRGLYLAMATFAFDLIVGVVIINTRQWTGGAQGLFGIPHGTSTPLILGIVLVTVLAISQLERGAIGRGFEAIRESDHLTVTVGIDLARRRQFVFALSAVLGALAGGLFALTFSALSPGTAGFGLVIRGLTMAVIGGIGSWAGAAIGAIFVAWTPGLLEFAGLYREMVYGVVLVGVVIYAPDGIFGAWRSLRRIAASLQRQRSSDRADDVAETDAAALTNSGA